MAARRDVPSRGDGERQAVARGPRRWRPMAAALAVIVVAIVATAVVARPTPATAQMCAPGGAAVGTGVGQCAPNFTLADLRGRRVSLSDFRGHPVLLHFWAVGCITCAGEYADFSRVVRTYAPKGLTVLDVDAWGEQPGLVRQWQSAHHLAATILVDVPIAVFNRYGGTGTPTTFFIDRGGHITASSAGALSFGDYQRDLSRIV